MGYFTDYYLTASPVDMELHEKIDTVLNDKVGIVQPTAIGSWENPNDTWYDHDEDMLEISKMFPDILFRLHGIGETHENVWTTYYKNGQAQFCPVYELEWPIIPYRWTGMHKDGRFLVCDTKTSEEEDCIDSVHNALFQCIDALRDKSKGTWDWDKDVLDRALATISEFMRHEGIPIGIQPSKQKNSSDLL